MKETTGYNCKTKTENYGLEPVIVLDDTMVIYSVLKHNQLNRKWRKYILQTKLLIVVIH